MHIYNSHRVDCNELQTVGQDCSTVVVEKDGGEAENGFEVAVRSLGTHATVTFGTINFVAKCF